MSPSSPHELRPPNPPHPRPGACAERLELTLPTATVRGVSRSERTTGDPARGTRVHRSRQAEAVASVLDRLPGFCSAQQIHAELRDGGEQVGLTTVYRHLQVLSENGRIDA